MDESDTSILVLYKQVINSITNDKLCRKLIKCKVIEKQFYLLNDVLPFSI